jgi:hypothetical protein
VGGVNDHEGEPESDPLDVLSSYIAGNQLVLTVGHGGGCAEHDYAVCYGQWFLESNPVQGGLYPIHDGHGDACEAYLTMELRFDLTPYADYYNDAYRSEGGTIITNYGDYVFGELTCDERSNVSEKELQAAVAGLDAAQEFWGTQCVEDSDCTWVELDSGCSPTPICSVLVGLVDGFDESLERSFSAVANDICGDFEADGCERLELPRSCGATPAPICLNGECTLPEN